ncbi:MAG: Maf family protein [Myxococcota bacterium]
MSDSPSSADARPSDDTLVLASRSPRRHQLLAEAGIAFEALPVDLDETPVPGEGAEATVIRLAREKAQAGAERVAPGRLVLGSDTGVILDDRLFGKPTDAADAVRLLETLLGRTHRVTTAVALAESGSGRVWSCAVSTEVTMRAAPRDEVEAYVATGEPMDKAGGYGFQGEGRRFVTRIEGSATNVIGLPLDETRALLERAARERGSR